MPDMEQIQELVNDLATRLGGRMAGVSGPAVVVVLTEIAKADGMELEALLEMVAAQYGVATGELFEGTDLTPMSTPEAKPRPRGLGNPSCPYCLQGAPCRKHGGTD